MSLRCIILERIFYPEHALTESFYFSIDIDKFTKSRFLFDLNQFLCRSNLSTSEEFPHFPECLCDLRIFKHDRDIVTISIRQDVNKSVCFLILARNRFLETLNGNLVIHDFKDMSSMRQKSRLLHNRVVLPS